MEYIIPALIMLVLILDSIVITLMKRDLRETKYRVACLEESMRDSFDYDER